MQFKNVEEMLTELNAQDKGRYFLCQCPDCKKPEAFIYKNNLRRVTCNRDNECGASHLVTFCEKEQTLQNSRRNMAQVYPTLTKSQLDHLQKVSLFVETYQLVATSQNLDEGYRGLSRQVTQTHIADLTGVNQHGQTAMGYFYKQLLPLLEKDYSEATHMLKRNIVMPIFDKHGLLERVLLRSSETVEPKEIQLVLNPSKDTKDFFVDLNGQSKVVVITEALFDGMSFKEVHPEINYLALTGVNRTRKLLNYLKDNREYFADKHFVIAMDNDLAGKRASDHIMQTLIQEEIGANHQMFAYPEGMNDPNEFLQQDRMVFKRSMSFALRHQQHKATEVRYG